jgi:hypothetical protein
MEWVCGKYKILEDLDVEWGRLLKRTFNKWSVRTWTGFISLGWNQLGGGGRGEGGFEHCSGKFGFHKCAAVL